MPSEAANNNESNLSSSSVATETENNSTAREASPSSRGKRVETLQDLQRQTDFLNRYTLNLRRFWQAQDPLLHAAFKLCKAELAGEFNVLAVRQVLELLGEATVQKFVELAKTIHTAGPERVLAETGQPERSVGGVFFFLVRQLFNLAEQILNSPEAAEPTESDKTVAEFPIQNQLATLPEWEAARLHAQEIVTGLELEVVPQLKIKNSEPNEPSDETNPVEPDRKRLEAWAALRIPYLFPPDRTEIAAELQAKHPTAATRYRTTHQELFELLANMSSAITDSSKRLWDEDSFAGAVDRIFGSGQSKKKKF